MAVLENADTGETARVYRRGQVWYRWDNQDQVVHDNGVKRAARRAFEEARACA